MTSKISKCRVCGNTNLAPVLDLGEQMLTGVFPRTLDAKVTTGPLRLVKCIGDDAVCGLLQLEHSSDLTLVGVDPTGVKFHAYYPAHVQLIADFFSATLVQERFAGRKAKVVTSFSMFYDLEDPLQFMREVHEVLEDDGVWVFEQSYMPTMLEMNSFDTACHEHLEYYALKQIQWMAHKVGFRIVDLEFNDVNGGSFSVTVTKGDADAPLIPAVQEALRAERELGLDTLTPYLQFARRASQR